MTKTELQAMYEVMFTDYPDIVNVAQVQSMLRFASLADFLKVLLITTWSPSSSLWEEIRIIIPRR